MSLEDVDLSTITNPWNTGFDDTTLLLERPLDAAGSSSAADPDNAQRCHRPAAMSVRYWPPSRWMRDMAS